MKRYLVPTKRASRGAATSPTTGEAARDRTVKAARPVDENMLADGSVETETSNDFRDRGQEAAHPRLQERGRPSRALISVASGDFSACSPRCQCFRNGLDIGSHCWIIPEPVDAGGGEAYWRGNMAPRGTPGSRWNMTTEHYPEDDKTGFSPSLRPGRGAPIGWYWWTWRLPWGDCSWWIDGE